MQYLSKRRAALASAILAAGLAVPAGAQQLTIPSGPYAPGTTVNATISDDTGNGFIVPAGCELRFLRPSGETVSPIVLPGQFCDILTGLPPGGSAPFPFTAPNQPGTYLVVIPYATGAVARLDVGSVAPSVPEVSFFPAGVRFPQTARETNFANPGNSQWWLSNIGTTPHTFVVGDSISVRVPGPGSPIATLSLAGITVQPSKVAAVTLPVAGLTPGPYELEASFADPVAGFTTVRSGIRQVGSRVELFLPDGRELQPGGSLSIALALQNFPTSGPAAYVVLLGLAPGSTPLPDGTLVPVVASDGFVVQSLTSALFGLFGNHVGFANNLYGPGAFFFDAEVTGITLAHPNIPGVAGIPFRLAAVGLDPAQTVFGGSQPESILLF